MDNTIVAQAGVTVLGIDPGLQRTGYGVIRKVGHKVYPVAWGIIKSGEGDLATRIGRLYAGIVEQILIHKPDVASIEIVFVNVNPQSTLLLGQARGAALAALSSHHLSVFELTALQVKQSIVGHGRATKEQVRTMVHTLLNLSDESNQQVMTFDAADALACALSCSFQIGKTLAADCLSPLAKGSLLSPSATANQKTFLAQTRRKRKGARWTSLPD